MLLLFLFMMSDAAAMDLAAAAVTATTVGGAAALGLSYYRVPLLLTKLPSEDSSFAVAGISPPKVAACLPTRL